ncbi:unnamed protein product, partial [Ectocarpus fasciculatus]
SVSHSRCPLLSKVAMKSCQKPRTSLHPSSPSPLTEPMTPSVSTTMSEEGVPAAPPAPEVQKEMIAEAMKLEMKQGQVWYVLGSKWWQLWRAFVRFDDEKEPPPPAAAETAEPAAPSSMDEDGVLVKAEDVAGVVGKADTNEHRVAELSLEEGGTISSG